MKKIFFFFFFCTLVLVLTAQNALAHDAFETLSELADGRVHKGVATNASGPCQTRLTQQNDGSILVEISFRGLRKAQIQIPANSRIEVGVLC